MGSTKVVKFEPDSGLNEYEMEYSSLNDLTQLSVITLENVANCIMQRFLAKHYYTFAGSVLVSVNPCQKDASRKSLKDREWQDIMLYERLVCSEVLDFKTVQPHVFAMGLRALRSLFYSENNQVIIVTGDSGAGKTTCTQELIRFLCFSNNRRSYQYNSGSFNLTKSLEQKICSATIILEAFGNASTIANPNSSRFGRLVKLTYNRNKFITGAEIKSCLLEKHRVANCSIHERNFHIFYYILEGVSQGYIDASYVGFSSLNEKNIEIFNKIRNTDLNDFIIFIHALEEFGISGMFLEVYQVIFAIIHLNLIEFENIFDPDNRENIPVADQQNDFRVAPSQQHHLQSAASLLQISKDKLEDVLVAKTISPANRKSVFRSPCRSIEECEMRLRSLTTFIYSTLFEHILNFLNELLKKESDSLIDMSKSSSPFSPSEDPYYRYISLLDLYGFESLETNHLEQLCINFANEKLQEIQLKTLHNYFEEELFIREMDFDVNSGDLMRIHSEITSRTLEIENNIFSPLDEQSMIKRMNTNEDFNAYSVLCNGPNAKKLLFIKPKLNSDTLDFSIKHYANNVSYSMQGMVEKNKDFIPEEFSILMKSSINKTVHKIFYDQKSLKCTAKLSGTPQGSQKRTNRGPTILKQFKLSLGNLLRELQESDNQDLQFIRCIRPNSNLLPSKTESDLIVNQLHTSGMVDIIRIIGNDHPFRLTFGKFEKEFKTVRKNICGDRINKRLEIVFSFGNNSLKIGKTSIFLNERNFQLLKKFDTFVKMRAARVIQDAFKNYIYDPNDKTPVCSSPADSLYFTPGENTFDFSSISQISDISPGPGGDAAILNLADISCLAGTILGETKEINSSSDSMGAYFDTSEETLTIPPFNSTENKKKCLKLARGSGVVSKSSLHSLPIKFYTRKTALGFAHRPPKRLTANGVEDALEDYGIIVPNDY